MNIMLFKRPYTVRSYGSQTIKDGYASAPCSDSVKMLNVQPLGNDELQNLPEGDRTTKRVKAYGPDALTAADDYSGVPGDRLFYRGHWYECKASVLRDNTPIGQVRSDFVILPPAEQEPPPGHKEAGRP